MEEKMSYGEENAKLKDLEPKSQLAYAAIATKLENLDTPNEATLKNPSRRKRKRNPSINSSDDEEDRIPTSLRKTARGGYSHTKKSKARIAKANKGNTPWNKGRNRSEADKAKIAAGVRARNRAVLLEKLKQFNMTEEEYHKKQKEIKYLREKVRKMKVAAKIQREQDLFNLQTKLNEAIAVRDKVKNTKTGPIKKEVLLAMQKEEEAKVVLAGKILTKTKKQVKVNKVETTSKEKFGVMKKEKDDIASKGSNINVVADVVAVDSNPPSKKNNSGRKKKHQKPKDIKVDRKKGSIVGKDHVVNTDNEGNFFNKRLDVGETGKQNLARITVDKMIANSKFPMMLWNMEWMPNKFDDLEEYKQTCPINGPGGLICCEACSVAYSNLMVSTLQDMEGQRLEAIVTQTEELLGYVEETRRSLMLSTQEAQKKNPSQHLSKVTYAEAETVKNVRKKTHNRSNNTLHISKESHKKTSSPMEWSITSTLDMNSWGPTCARI